MPRLGGRFRRVRLPIRTARLSLRLPRPSDVPELTRYFRDRRILRPLTVRRAPFSRADEVRFVRGARRGAARGEFLRLAITLRDTGELVGGIGLEGRPWETGRGWTGYWLAPRHWHRGYGSEAASAVFRLAFRELGLHRIDAEVFEFNRRSARLLRRLGFRREGRRRAAVRRGGRWVDELQFGLLRDEFRPYRGRRSPRAPPRLTRAARGR